MGFLFLTSFIIALHTARKIKPAEIKVLLKRMIDKDRNNAEKYINHYKSLYPIVYERHIKKEFEGLTNAK